MSPRIESLHTIERSCWIELGRASVEREHPWRVLALATVDGLGADARSVVLREVRPEQRTVVFYTDSRSPKVRQVQQHPEATLLAWSRELSWQLRLRVTLEVADSGPEVTARWSSLQFSPAAQDYLAPMAPGDPLQPDRNQAGTRAYFAVVTAKVQAMDWLELHADGPRRALFDARGARWVQP